MKREFAAVFLIFVVGCCPIALATESWTHLRGPAGDGRLPADALASGALEADWRVPIGSGYSGIVAAGDRVVTMYADGDEDVLAAHDIASGKRLWRVSLGPMYAGHDGSDDGPLSSPVIARGSRAASTG